MSYDSITPPRDSYRSRVYEAEDSLYDTVGFGQHFDRLLDAAIFIANIVTSGHLQRNHSAICNSENLDYVEVCGPLGGNQRAALAIQTEILASHEKCPKISLPTLRPGTEKMWTELVLLHELAHILTPRIYAFHGEEWCRNYLWLVQEYMSEDIYFELQYQLDMTGVFGWNDLIEMHQMRLFAG